MAQNCKYYKEKKQVSYDNGVTYIDVTPAEYRRGDLIQANSPDCGYSYAERWIDSGTTCSGYDKYSIQVKQTSTDGGQTWTTTTDTRQGTLVEANSEDCGYIPNYSAQCLTFYALQDMRVTWSGTHGTAPGTATGRLDNRILQYSLDGGTNWYSTDGSNSITVRAGKKIMFKGDLIPIINYSSDYFGIGEFTTEFINYPRPTTGICNVEGNIMSLVYSSNFENRTIPSVWQYCFHHLFDSCMISSAENLILPSNTSYGCYTYMFRDCDLSTPPELPATTLNGFCYFHMFESCDKLTSVPSNMLPATTLSESCYEGMFDGCTSLTSTPSLPATTLAVSCYEEMFKECTSLTTVASLPAMTMKTDCYNAMFYGCTSLATAPTLSATTLAQNCYAYMFYGCTSLTTAPSTLPATTLETFCYGRMFSGCTSLTTAPDLPAATLANSCYKEMFAYCSSLNYVKCLATNITATDSTTDWVKRVASSGTFVKAASMVGWATGSDGIPYNWTVQNA